MITTFINSKKIPHPVSSVIMFGRMVLESLISASTVTQIPGWERSHADTIAWSYDMEGQCEEMSGKVLRIGKQEHPAIMQSLHTVYG